MKKVSLFPYLGLAFVCHTISPLFGSFFKVLFFAPFFSTLYARKPLFICLWASFFIGLFLDLSTTSTPLGFYPVCCVLTTMIIHKYKIFFFEEKPHVFALYTALYSFVYSIIFTVLYTFFDPTLFSFNRYVLIDLVCLPILDTCYHLVFFTLPVSMYLYFFNFKAKRLIIRIRRLLTSIFRSILTRITNVHRKRTL